jgi:hypothetical protein
MAWLMSLRSDGDRSSDAAAMSSSKRESFVVPGIGTIQGSDAVQYPRFAEERRESDAKAWHNISVLTDAEDVKGLPNLKF